MAAWRSRPLNFQYCSRMEWPLDPALPLPLFVIGTIVANGLLFVISGGALHYAFYVKQADTASEWRIQADRPMPTREVLLAVVAQELPLQTRGIVREDQHVKGMRPA